MPISKKYAPYVYIIAGMAIFVCMGTIYSWSVFRNPLEELFGIGATQSGWPYMLFLCFYALAMPFAGGLIERLGPGRTTLIGGAILSAAWFVSGSATGITTLSLTYGVFGGIGVGLIYGAPLAVAARWFPRKKGLAVGLTLAGFGLSPFVTAPVAVRLIESYGVLPTFRIFGVVFFLCITVLSFFLRFPDKPPVGQSAESRAAATADTDTMGMLKTRSFYGLWICYAIGTFAGLMAISVTSPVAQEIIRLKPETAAFAVSAFAVFNALGRPLFGSLTDRFGTRAAIGMSYILITAASMCLLVAGSGDAGIYFVAFSLLWLALGGWLAIAPVSTVNLFGALHYCKNYGFVFTAYGAGALAGGLTSGLIKDHFGSYQYAFYVTAAMALAGIAINLIAIPRNVRRTAT